MSQYVICPECLKSVAADENSNVCPVCGQRLDMTLIRRKGFLIDSATEQREFAAGKDYFVNTEFLGARQHFEKALAANKNSYLSQYFVLLCGIYLNDNSGDADVMRQAVDAVCIPLDLSVRANVSVNDRLNFITAVLSEIKIIIINRLRSYDSLFELDIAKYRHSVLKDLQTLLALFKIDDEKLMVYSPNVKAILEEVAEIEVAVCHKAVQTVAIGEELFSPSEFEYNRLVSLNNDYCYFATSYNPSYDAKKYTPDFTQNNLLNDKVMSRFIKFDAQNKQNAKKHVIGDITEYNDILSECEKALSFTYLNCFRSLCDTQFSKRKTLLKDGIRFLYRLLTPRVVVSDKKKPDILFYTFVDVAEKCKILTQFLVDSDAADDMFARDSLREFYARLCDTIESFFNDEYERNSKNINRIKEARGDEYKYYERFLFDTACCCASALSAYVPFTKYKDKNRLKIVRICKQASEDFLLLRDYHIDEIDQSNIYRPILDIYNAVMKEIEV